MLKFVSSMSSKREGILLALLLVSLLWISGTNFGLRESRSASLIQDGFLEVVGEDKDKPDDREQWRAHLSWYSKEKRIPQTNVIHHAPGMARLFGNGVNFLYLSATGWTIFDNLYVLNGTVYVVTDAPESVPPRERMTSTAIDVRNGKEAVAARLPSDREMRIISTEEGRKIFGTTAEIIDGVTVRIFLHPCHSDLQHSSGS